jgi:4-amino-4-deoxy-L-arabinose transferase-like glycosyltransferase
VSTTAPPLRRAAPGHATGAALRRRARLLVHGHSDDAAWVRPALLAVLALATVLCLWHLTISGYSNTYYAAAVKSADVSWKALFFGSLDPGSFITVDKPPLSIWLMGLSARVFGFGSFSMLLPQALCTVAAVGLLYATVRRAFGPAAGIAAGTLLALTPVTVAVARVNNPDALLVLLLVAGAYCLQRSLESGRTKHLVACAALVGLAFMTKMLEGWLLVPAFAAAYLVAGPPRLLTRVRQLAVAGVAMVAVSAAWPVAVELWPGSKPYIGGSTDGSVWDLILGYNGFGRLTGESGGGGGASFGGSAGVLRMFNEQVGGQVAWLIPFAGLSLLAGLWMTRRAPRTDRRRAMLVMLGVWALTAIALFSSQRGTFHPYYVSTLAPAVAALSGIGLVLLGTRARESWGWLAALAAGVAATAWLAVALLGRTADFAPALRVAIPLAAAVAVVALVLVRAGVGGRRLPALVAAVAVAVALAAGPASYSFANLGHALNGNNVLAGPSSVSQGGFGGGPRGGAPGGAPGGGAATGPGGGGATSTQLIAYLEAHQGTSKYLVAATGSQSTASIILATGKPVVTIGGFTGSDPAPTVSQLSAMVASGELRYVLVSSGGGGGPDRGSSAIATWVKQHGTAVSGAGTSGETLYRVTAS